MSHLSGRKDELSATSLWNDRLIVMSLAKKYDVHWVLRRITECVEKEWPRDIEEWQAFRAAISESI